MIHLTFHDAGTLAVRGGYEHRATLKALATYPEVQWSGEHRCWLVDARLYDKLAGWLGHEFAPLSDEFLRKLPPPADAPGAPAKRRFNPKSGRGS